MSNTKERNEVRTVSEISTDALRKVKEIMRFSDFFPVNDDDSSEHRAYENSWYEDIPKSDFEEIALLICQEGFNIDGFQLLEIPHPKVFCFGNSETEQYFDVVKLWDNKWQFSYIEDSMNKLARSISEAVEKYEID